MVPLIAPVVASLRDRYLGRKGGRISSLYAGLATVPAEQKRELGARLRDHIRHEERVLFPLAEDALPTAELDRLYLKLSHFYRADCVYDLGRYEEAIKLYDAASLKYQDDSSSLAAYVQIVNSYCALGKLDEATETSTAALRQRPDEPRHDPGS